MVQAMRGGSPGLRNSDHVPPERKTELLEEVMNCWIRVCQILVVLSPILAENRFAAFEGMGFWSGKGFDKEPSNKERWQKIMTVIADNVVIWYQEDIFSRKKSEPC